jgi:hypothetical protein
MTSANVVQYRIEDLNGKQVGKHYQSLLCKTHWGELLVFQPSENFTITAFGEDEEEAYWEDEPINLKVFIDKLVASKAKFNTFKSPTIEYIPPYKMLA